MTPEDDQPARAAAEAVARRSYGKLVAFLAARTRDVAGAEDALSEAFAAALVDWPASGIPASPEAWLMTVARRKTIDAARRRRSHEEATPHLQLIGEELEAAVASDTQIPDQRLLMMFACAHPAIDPGIRAPMILQTILGFDAATIASAFLVSPATMGQRLVRAKSKIRQAGIPFRLPECPSGPICASGWPRCWAPSTRPSRKAGRTPPAPSCAAAASPKRESGSAGWWSRCCRRSRRRSASSP
jgi:RNA polymerase sigma-70 factor (ECF subfamily)